MIELARKNALAIGAGHSFIVFLADGYYPVNVLNTIKQVTEVCHIFCATANPTEVLVAETELGRGILGVVDGASPKGIEAEARHCLAQGLPAEDRLQGLNAYNREFQP